MGKWNPQEAIKGSARISPMYEIEEKISKLKKRNRILKRALKTLACDYFNGDVPWYADSVNDVINVMIKKAKEEINER